MLYMPKEWLWPLTTPRRKSHPNIQSPSSHLSKPFNNPYPPIIKQKIIKNTHTSVQEDPFLQFSLIPEWSPKTPLSMGLLEFQGFSVPRFSAGSQQVRVLRKKISPKSAGFCKSRDIRPFLPGTTSVDESFIKNSMLLCAFSPWWSVKRPTFVHSCGISVLELDHWEIRLLSCHSLRFAINKGLLKIKLTLYLYLCSFM